VDFVSDGGQSHFKCAEAFVYLCHLLRELRGLRGAHRGARIVWNFMQSYHGKGPYDAEVRPFLQLRSFVNALLFE
jgi:hypothetical protein